MAYKHLPHFDLLGCYQFITFRTFDSTDSFLAKLVLWDMSNSKRQMAMDDYLDHSTQGNYLNSDVLLKLHAFLMKQDTLLYDLAAFSIMPNHVHLLIRPYLALSLVMQKIKGGSAREINRVLGKTGVFWAKSYYDRAIRDERHFSLVYEYIKHNPDKLMVKSDVVFRFYGVYESA